MTYHQQYQIPDVDLTGLPCGKKAALATKGYFAGVRNLRGRQLGRVLATRYQALQMITPQDALGRFTH
jgi:hypothetical protein